MKAVDSVFLKTTRLKPLFGLLDIVAGETNDMRIKRVVIAAFLVLVALGLVIANLMLVVAAWMQADCSAVPKSLGLACQMYASDHSDLWPRLSKEPGNFMLAYDDLVPEYISENSRSFVCPEEAREIQELPMREQLAHNSYLYFGYALMGEDEVLAFLESYPAFLDGQADFNENLPAPAGRGSFGGDAFLRLREGLAEDHGLTPEDIPVIFESMWYSKANRQFVPHHTATRPGGWVTYMSGHTKFIEFPDEYPVAQTAFDAMRTLK
jgi:hypothetical protein